MVEHKDCDPMLIVKYSSACPSNTNLSTKNDVEEVFSAEVLDTDTMESVGLIGLASLPSKSETTYSVSPVRLDTRLQLGTPPLTATATARTSPQHTLKKTTSALGEEIRRSQRITGGASEEPCGQKENRLKMPGGPLRPEELCRASSSKIRTKMSPSREMNAALKVINDALHQRQPFHRDSSLASSSFVAVTRSAKRIVQMEWFQVSSTEHANPLDVEDYLDCFEEFSNALLRYMVNIHDKNGNTAMHYAVSHGNFDVVSILLDSKLCDVNHTNNAGYTCVMLVSLAQLNVVAHYTVVKRLFQMSDVNVRAKKQCQTALMLAVSHGNVEMVQMLLTAGADINIQDQDGNTALMCAAEHGRIDIVKLLLSQTDCDSTICDVNESTAHSISVEAGHRDISILLGAHEHIARSKTSPCTSLRRKKNANKAFLRSAAGGSLTAGGSASMPSSPMPSTKFRHNYRPHHSSNTRDSQV